MKNLRSSVSKVLLCFFALSLPFPLGCPFFSLCYNFIMKIDSTRNDFPLRSNEVVGISKKKTFYIHFEIYYHRSSLTYNSTFAFVEPEKHTKRKRKNWTNENWNEIDFEKKNMNIAHFCCILFTTLSVFLLKLFHFFAMRKDFRLESIRKILGKIYVVRLWYARAPFASQ